MGIDHRTEMSPLVSVITPSLNQDAFIASAIDSIRHQTYPNIEHIVIDGGSTDTTVDILRSTSDVTWLSEPDSGQSEAINKGMRMARGEILCYLNADDTLETSAIGTFVNEIGKGYDFVYCDANVIDETGEIIGAYPTRGWEPNALIDDCFICQPGSAWTRDLMEAIGPFDEALDMAMDYDYWIRIAKSGRPVSHISQILANTRDHAMTKTRTRQLANLKTLMTLTRRHFGRVPVRYVEAYWHNFFRERPANPLGRGRAIKALIRADFLWKNFFLTHVPK